MSRIFGIFVLLSLALSALAADQTCKIFDCGVIENKDNTKDKFICSHYDDKALSNNVNDCPDADYMCNLAVTSVTDNMCSIMATPTEATLLNGQICTDMKYCESGVCTDKKCVGLGADKACDNTDKTLMCDAGLYCTTDTKLCTAVGKADGTADCTADSAICPSGTSCIGDATKKMCLPFFSVKVAAAADNMIMCETNYLDGTTGMCAAGPKLKTTGAQTNLDTECVYEPALTGQKSMCGFNKTSESYCPMSQGDISAASFTAVKAYIAQEGGIKCPSFTSIIELWACKEFMDMISSDSAIKTAAEEFWMTSSPTAFPFVADNETCIMASKIPSVYSFYMVKGVPKVDSALALSLGASVVAFLASYFF